MQDQPPPTLAQDAAAPAAPASAGRRTGRAEPAVLLAVAVGGALGAAARYGVAQLVSARPGAFPWATLAVNVSGSFALGLVLTLLLERFGPTRFLRPFLATGLLGAYTTYSSFAVEADLLVRDGRAAVAVAYVVASLAAGLAAVWAGIRAVRILPVHHPAAGGRP